MNTESVQRQQFRFRWTTRTRIRWPCRSELRAPLKWAIYAEEEGVIAVVVAAW